MRRAVSAAQASPTIIFRRPHAARYNAGLPRRRCPTANPPSQLTHRGVNGATTDTKMYTYNVDVYYVCTSGAVSRLA